jgi:hypothetical protein
MQTAKDELLETRRGLVASRRELKAKLTGLARDITALDRVLLILDPDYRPEAGRGNRRGGATPNTPFKHGEMSSAALDALRLLKRPASTSETATAMLERKGIANDPEMHALVVSRVSAVFAQKAASGQLRRVQNGDARQARWEIAR